MFTAASAAVARLRAGEGPELIEALTYRHLGHSKSDPAAYRPAEEVAAWLERDPLVITRTQLVDTHGVAPEKIAEIEERVAKRIEVAVDAALAAPYPDPAPASAYSP